MLKKPAEPTSKEIYKKTVELIEREKIFFLFTGDSIKPLIEASEYLWEHGFNLIGIDFRIPGVKNLLKSVKRKGQRNLGVFSISTRKDARIAINAGALFIFSTHADKGIIRRCKKENLFHAIGALTPTEIFNAYDLGAEAVSIYPSGRMGGLSWFMLLREIFPKVKFVPTDTMSPYEASQCLKAGAYAVAPIIDLDKVKEPKELIREFSVNLSKFRDTRI
ncbi:MAG: bifunctional 4-hydroxy-2-oxoglutarate aldolase/2-dehydro-3-deoxy-phosphogluconate aldolase [Thermodesulfobacteriota bacterium]